MAYSNTMAFSNGPAEELANLLVAETPGISRAFFVSSGSAAMEAALKLARQYFVEKGEPERVHFISRQQSYHGNFFGSLAASGHHSRRAIYEDILPGNFSRVAPCFPYHGQAEGETDSAYVSRLGAELESEFQRLGPGKVIAFVAETVVGAAAGCVAALPGYFHTVREICNRHGALLILDEIMCGMGRTGTIHAWQQEGVQPDIQAIGKGLGGGYAPIGGILISRRVVEALAAGTGSFVHGQTYQAHPVCCIAALEVQRIIREEELTARVLEAGSYLEAQLRERFLGHPFVGDIRGRGLFWAIEFVEEREARRPFPANLKIAERIRDASFRNGLGVYSASGVADGHCGDCTIFAPPYNTDLRDLDSIVDISFKSANQVFSEL